MTTYQWITVIVISLVTYGLRALPFALFSKGNLPPILSYLGDVLPAAVMGLLVVYVLKGITPMTFPYGLPEIIASIFVVAMHVWKKNMLLSVGVGTAFYMALVQFIFV